MEFTPSPAPLTRGVLARRSGCNIETIRYYETIALMPPPRRGANGYRLYGDADQRRLRFILRMRELGFAIDEIRGLLSMVDSGAYTCAEIHEMTQGHLASVRDKIAHLTRLERTLSTIAGQCVADAVPDCPVIDALWDD